MMDKKIKILVIAIGWEQEPLINRILEIENVELYGIHYNEEHSDFNFKEVLYIDLLDLNKVISFANKIKPDVVISDQDDYAHLCQALVSDLLDIPGPSFYQAQISSNKYLQRIKCKETGIRHPEFNLIYDLRQVGEFASKYGYPIIIKPIDNRGSFGVKKIESESEIKTAYYESIQNSRSRLLIVEQFIKGQEVTVDGYCFKNDGPDSVAVATKVKLDDKLQVSFEINYPGDLDKKLYDKIMSVNKSVIQKLGYTFGMTHAEYIISEDEEIYLVEAANRGGGCYTSEIIVPENSGIDLLTYYINDSFGDDILSLRPISPGEVTLRFLNFKPGKIKSINGLSKLEESKLILKSRISISNDKEIVAADSDANRHGFFILKSEKNTRKQIDEILNQINVEYYE